MHARQKIEGLTNSWYGFAVFSALAGLFFNGIGFFSLAWTIASTLVSFFITFLIGRALLNKSSFVRVVLIGLSGILSLVGLYGTAKYGYAFVQDWSLHTLLITALSGISVSMQVRSFRVLTDKSVSSYFAT